MNGREALKLGLQLVETAEYLATDSAICGNYVKEERALIQQSKIAFEEALAQPEQKPVVWFKTDNGWRKEEFEKTLVKKVPLDTTPPEPKPHVWFDFSNCDRYSSKEEFEKTLLNNVPQREWVGLTDEERDHFEGLHLYAARNQVEAWIEGVPSFIDAIEAKLREKNSC